MEKAFLFRAKHAAKTAPGGVDMTKTTPEKVSVTEGFANYRGEKYKIMNFDEAAKEFGRLKAKGLHSVIMSIQDGYIVAKAIFTEDTEEET